ncbi:MAG: hypothetical protein FJW39_27080 [Acidobacteria bacterium]|nr:hypothetical protein [Acidobacteriota bacterium]
MPSGGAATRNVRFGEFLFDLEEHRLYKAGVEIPLNPKALEVLAHLVARPGHIASKDELLRAVWNPVTVTDDALVQRVLDIRKAMKDDPKNPRFIRTHSKRGYEWIGGTGDENPAEPASSAAQTSSKPPYHRALLILLGVQAVVAAFLWTLTPSAPLPPLSELHVTRLTATPGMEDFPAPEPTGSGRILFTANDGPALTLQFLDPATGKREPFGTAQAQYSQADWSPDGRQVAFRSTLSGGGIFRQSLRGTPVRISNLGHHPRWSPDATKIAFQTEGATGKIFIHDLNSGVNQAVSFQGPTLTNMAYPVWSPDGQAIYFLAISPAGGAVAGQVVLGHQVWRVPVRGGNPVLAAPGMGVVRDGGFDLRRDGLEMVFVGLDRSLWTLAIDKKTGLASGKARHLTLSTEEHQHPRYRAQGGIVFSTVASPDSLWLIPFVNGRPEASAMRRLTRDGMLARQAAADAPGRRVAFITWGGDRFEIWGIDIETSRSWRMSPPGGPSRVRPLWSRDGNALVYRVLDGPHRTYRAAWLDSNGQSVVREEIIPEPGFALANRSFHVEATGKIVPAGEPGSPLASGADLRGLEPRFAQRMPGRPDVYFMAADEGWFNLWRWRSAATTQPERITSFDGGRFHLSDSNTEFCLHPKGIIVSIRENRSDLWMIH